MAKLNRGDGVNWTTGGMRLNKSAPSATLPGRQSVKPCSSGWKLASPGEVLQVGSSSQPLSQ
ncbi:MAG: hypothetical protein WCG19_06750 [Chlorobiaceae bacterium]